VWCSCPPGVLRALITVLGMMDKHCGTELDSLETVAVQEVARVARGLRGALVSHLRDEQLDSGAVAKLSDAALGVLTEVALQPERYGLDPYGLEFG